MGVAGSPGRRALAMDARRRGGLWTVDTCATHVYGQPEGLTRIRPGGSGVTAIGRHLIAAVALAAGLAVAPLVPASAAPAQLGYTFRTFDVPGATGTQVNGVNDGGSSRAPSPTPPGSTDLST